MKLIPKYKIGDTVIRKVGTEGYKFLASLDYKAINSITLIEDIFLETDDEFLEYSIDSRIRYRLLGLWHNQDEIIVVTKEENPEYFL